MSPKLASSGTEPEGGDLKFGIVVKKNYSVTAGEFLLKLNTKVPQGGSL